MNDEIRDPEVQALRSHWEPPRPPEALDDQVLSAYRRGIRSRARIRRFWIPVAAAVALAAAAGLVVGARIERSLMRPAPVPTSTGTFVPVRQPRVIVVSQGEHP